MQPLKHELRRFRKLISIASGLSLVRFPADFWKVNKRLRCPFLCVGAIFIFNSFIRNGNSDRENVLLDSFINLFTLRDDDDQVKTLRFLKQIYGIKNGHCFFYANTMFR
ncbi:hypothetical protein CEXT_390341 [Caerostris extrusa]|uniref:LAGLIDADG homing endonuclease n=1 Tax=Caerostris extrusa TaxID=172846 RepID=A0AAV4MLZ8_CAEEX|nr:hypothetical protein CEXT_390341 [Caerostris extrusa]